MTEDEDNEELDLETESVITSYTQFELHRATRALTSGNILRPIARALGRLGAHLRVSLAVIMIEVAKAYDDFVENGVGSPLPKQKEPPPPPPVQVLGGSYDITIPRDTAVKLAEAGLVFSCGGGTHFHPRIPDDAPQREQEQMRVKIEHFIAGLCN